MTPQYDIFISYAHSDDESGWISQFVDNLQLAYENTTGKSLRIFIDKSVIKTADLWETKILLALKNSWLLVPVLSQEFFRSQWCTREWEKFREFEKLSRERNHLQDDEGLVVPVRYKEFGDDSQNLQTKMNSDRQASSRQWTDFVGLKPDGEAYRNALDILVRRLRAILESPITDSILEQLPVLRALNIDKIEYGEGIQIESIAGARLTHLNLYTTIEKEFVSFDGTFQYVPKRIIDAGILKASQPVRVPRRIVVSGRRSQSGNIVGVYVCVGIHYLQGFDRRRDTDLYEVECLIGRGGIADFVDNAGQFQNNNPLVFGNGLGAVCGIVVVEFEGRKPMKRSEHTIVIRAGIRYPEDIWISKNTGRPITSKDENIATARFIFQSRQPNGQSCDVFVAGFNGANMVNLTYKEEDAYDGFFNDSGDEVARWVDQDTIEYCSMSGGRRIIKKVYDQYSERVASS